jgi:hypothetical protein
LPNNNWLWWIVICILMVVIGILMLVIGWYIYADDWYIARIKMDLLSMVTNWWAAMIDSWSMIYGLFHSIH